MSFLDIMSCGFGAVVLVFLITKHSMSVHAEEVNEVLLAEVDRIEVDVEDGELNLVELVEALDDAERRISEAEASAASRAEELGAREIDLMRLKEITCAGRDAEDAAFRRRVPRSPDRGSRGDEPRRRSSRNAVLSIAGDGQRQYLTGLQVNGDRILILFDHSASMLDETIVNIIRRRNMDEARQRAAPKWQQATGTLRWLSAKLPRKSRFQLYTFSETWAPAIEGTEGRWLDVTGGQLNQAVLRATELLPQGGESEIHLRGDRRTRPASGQHHSGNGRPADARRARTPPWHGHGPTAPEPLPGRGRSPAAERAREHRAPAPRRRSHGCIDYWRLAFETQGSFLAPSRRGQGAGAGSPRDPDLAFLST